MAFLSEEIQEKFRKIFFPFNAENLGLFALIWLFLGFSLGLSTLFGPVRWIADLTIDYEIEQRLIKLLIGFYVISTALISAWLVRVWRRPGQRIHIKCLIILFAFCSGISSFLYMVFPSYFGSVSIIETSRSEKITFGPLPNKEQMQELKNKGYTVIIALLDPGILPEKLILDREKVAAREVGIQLIHIPMIPWVGEKTNDLAKEKFREIFSQEAVNDRYYVHCYLGADRVNIAKKMIQAIFPGLIEVQETHSNPLEKTHSLYNGKVIQLGNEIFIIPSPTRDEIFNYLGKMPLVTSILDPAFFREKGRIDELGEILKQFNTPYEVFSIPPIGIDPYQVLDVVQKMKNLSTPFVIETNDTDSARAEIFAQTFFYQKPSLAPSLFIRGMERGSVLFYRFNTVLGPRPTPQEFRNDLYENGIRKVLYLGNPLANEAVEDSQNARRANLEFRAVNDSDWPQIVMQDGPWYVYGTGVQDMRASRNKSVAYEELMPGIFLILDRPELDIAEQITQNKIHTIFFLYERETKQIFEQLRFLQSTQVNLVTQAIAKEPFIPEKVLEITAKIWSAEQPCAILIPAESTYLREALKQSFYLSKPPLPPSLLQSLSLQRGTPQVLAPNVAIGPRPTEQEFLTTLPNVGVQGFIYVGYPDDREAKSDKEFLTKHQKFWLSLDPELNSFYEFIINDGPWYIYGPGLTLDVVDRIGRKVGPSVPKTIFHYPVPSQSKEHKIMLEHFVDFRKIFTGETPIWRLFPQPATLILLLPVFIIYTALWVNYVGKKSVYAGVATAYTRKMFHFAIFFAAGILQITGGFPLVATFGGIVVLFILYAILRGRQFAFYQALARPKDTPHRTFFIVTPLLMTAFGGIVNNIFFGDLAAVGIFVTGCGDAIAEVVGQKFGRHRFSVPSLLGVKCKKTVEGTISIALVSAIAAMCLLGYIGVGFNDLLVIGTLVGLGSAVIELISFHGIDNFTVQVASSALAFYLLRFFGYL